MQRKFQACRRDGAERLVLVVMFLLDIALALEVLTLDKVWYLVIVIILLAVFSLAALLQALVALSQLAQ
jgi:hypothetical protein